MGNIDVNDRLIVGLDVANVNEAERMVNKLSPVVNFYKIGHQLAFTGGLDLAKDLINDGKKIFLDLKLLDIDNTIYKAVENIANLNVNMLTIHAYPKAMQAASEAAKGSDLCVLAVTVLTSMDQKDLNLAGYALSPEELVLKRVKQASELNMGGVVASALEACKIKELIRNDMVLVTPGIRPAGSDAGDQKRVMTPGEAIKSGATHLVVARPIIAAVDPLQSAVDILEEMSKNL